MLFIIHASVAIASPFSPLNYPTVTVDNTRAGADTNSVKLVWDQYQINAVKISNTFILNKDSPQKHPCTYSKSSHSGRWNL